MKPLHVRVFAFALVIVGAGVASLRLTDPAPAVARSQPTPTAQPDDLPQNGLVGRGTLVGRTALGGGSDTLTLGGSIAFEARGPLIRLDILSLGIPGADPTLSALAQSFIAPGGYTVVYDRGTSAYVVWSKAKQTYYQNSVGNVGEKAPQPVPSAASHTGVGESDLLGAFGFAKSLKDLKNFTIQLGLVGHSQVNGHAATGMDFLFSRQTTAGDPLNVHGRIQFADDLDGFPVQVNATVKTKSFGLDAQLDLTQVEKRVPDAADFDIPPGFARAQELGGVLGGAIPIPH
jgi:hypothetical protein